jgi:hypothetical protein
MSTKKSSIFARNFLHRPGAKSLILSNKTKVCPSFQAKEPETAIILKSITLFHQPPDSEYDGNADYRHRKCRRETGYCHHCKTTKKWDRRSLAPAVNHVTAGDRAPEAVGQQEILVDLSKLAYRIHDLRLIYRPVFASANIIVSATMSLLAGNVPIWIVTAGNADEIAVNGSPMEIRAICNFARGLQAIISVARKSFARTC